MARGAKGLDRSGTGVIAKPKGVASWVEAKGKYLGESTRGGMVPLGSGRIKKRGAHRYQRKCGVGSAAVEGW